MKPRVSRYCLVAIALLFLGSGCGITRVNEHRTYIALNRETGDVSLFRVSINGYAEMSETKYSAGWKSAEAVDELFKDIAAPLGGTDDKEIQVMQAAQLDLVQKLSGKIREAGSDPAQAAKVKQYEEMLVNARSLIRRVRARETSEVPYAPAEKFVIVFSSNPNRVFGELANIVDRQANEGSILKSLSSLKGRQEQREETTPFLWNQILTNTAGFKVEGNDAAALQKAAANLEIYRQKLTDFQEGTK